MMRCSALDGWLIRVAWGLAVCFPLHHAWAANELCLLDDNRLALAVRAELIRSARCEISIACYAIDSGEVPLGMLALLREAAKRGVLVRVVVDGLQTRLPSDFETMLAREGVYFRKYHPPHKGHPAWLNRRMHTKLLVVDRQAMVIGSRNLQDHHFGLERINYIDCEAFLAGDVCKQAAAYFDCLWQADSVFPAAKSNSIGLDLIGNLKMNVTPLPLHRAQRETKYQRALAGGLACVNKIVGQVDAGNCVDAPCIPGVSACLLHDGVVPKTQRRLQTSVVDLLDSARESIHLETPYPVFSRPIFDALRRASCRGVSISMLTNSLESTDYVSTYAAYQNHKDELLRMGVDLYELCSRDHLHAKTMVIDWQLAMLGSYNFDVRSDRLNLEMSVVVRDPRVAQVVMQASRQRICRAQKISPGDRCPEVGGDFPLRKQARMRAGQIVVPLYRRSL